MIKYLLCLFLIIFLHGIQSVQAQTVTDSVTVQETAAGDTTVFTDSSSEETEISDSMMLPVTDSAHQYPDTLREVSARQVKSYVLNPDYAYANDPEYWKKEKAAEPGFQFNFLNNPILRWVVFLGIAGLVVLGLYRLAKENNFRWFARRSGRKIPVAFEDIPDEETNYDEAIRKFQAEGDYRMAIRYMYLRLIRQARELGGFQIRDSSTNAEIARAFSKHPQGKEFGYLTMAYEYIFYGGFLPREELYQTLKTRFDIFQQKQIS